MKLIRSLVFPWFLFFAAVIGGMIAVGIRFTHLQVKVQTMGMPLLIGGAILCVFWNLNTLSSVGIWMHESLPESLRYGSGRWILRAFKAAIVAAAFWGIGQLPWVPLIWNAAILPAALTITLFVLVFSLVGPILKFASNLAWSRAFSVIFSLPVLALVPITALFIGKTFVYAYRASHADIAMAQALAPPPSEPISVRGRVISVTPEETRIQGEWPVGSGKKTLLTVDMKALTPDQADEMPKTPQKKEITLKLDPKAVKPVAQEKPVEQAADKDIPTQLRSSKPEVRAAAFRALAESGKPCSDYSREISAAIDPKGNKEVVLWAVKALECSDVKTVIGMQKLASIMMDHEDPLARAAAIRGFKKYGWDNVKQISYLIVKRLSAQEPPEVVEAASHMLAALGGDHPKFAVNRLKQLLDTDNLSGAAAKALMQDHGREDLVSEYVAANLPGAPQARARAVSMICSLSKEKRAMADAHVSGVIATVKTGDAKDPAVQALKCMGKVGFDALKAELLEPKQLDRTVAARAFSELEVKEYPEAIDVANNCARDQSEEVRKSCSETLGEIGAPALPKILDLLNSGDGNLKESGRVALENFADANAKGELRKVMEANSGWMANPKKLKIAEAVGTALAKIELSEKQGAGVKGPGPASQVQ